LIAGKGSEAGFAEGEKGLTTPLAKSLKSHFPKIPQQALAGVLKQVENLFVHCLMII
jgi:hypothetical protein